MAEVQFSSKDILVRMRRKSVILVLRSKLDRGRDQGK